MTPTNEQIFAEALRRQKERGGGAVTDFIIEVVRENWTPPEPEPVDPDILAFHAWRVDQLPYVEASERSMTAKAYLAGARMAREQELERAKVLVECLDNLQQFSGWADGQRAAQALAKYRGEA